MINLTTLVASVILTNPGDCSTGVAFGYDCCWQGGDTALIPEGAIVTINAIAWCPGIPDDMTITLPDGTEEIVQVVGSDDWENFYFSYTVNPADMNENGQFTCFVHHPSNTITWSWFLLDENGLAGDFNEDGTVDVLDLVHVITGEPVNYQSGIIEVILNWS